MSETSLETSSSESFTSLLRSDDGQTAEKISGHPAQLFLQDGKLASADPSSSQTSWTDEKHRLYLNSIEDAFVTSLYNQGYYTCFAKRWQADRGEIRSVNTQNSTEEVESWFGREYHEPFAYPEESQSESEIVESHPGVVNHSNGCRSKEKRFGYRPSKKQVTKRDTKLGRTKKRKFEHEFNGGLPGPRSARRSSDHESAGNKYQGRQQVTENRRVSDPSAKILSNGQEDQVVPSIKDLPGREDVRL